MRSLIVLSFLALAGCMSLGGGGPTPSIDQHDVLVNQCLREYGHGSSARSYSVCGCMVDRYSATGQSSRPSAAWVAKTRKACGA